MIKKSVVVTALTLAAAAAFAADAPTSGPAPIPPEVSPSPPPKAAPSPKTAASPKAAKPQTSPPLASKVEDSGTVVMRGKRLVDSHDCHACHTPMKMGPKGPEPDMSMALAGHPQKLVMPPPPKLEGPWGWIGSNSNTAFAGPWGITYAINLTPDPETGIGKWREQDFVLAIKTGKHMGVGREIMPPMPWPAYKNLSETELRAMYAYLKTIPPVKNRAPDYAPPK